MVASFELGEGLATELTHRDFIVFDPVWGHIPKVTLRDLEVNQQGSENKIRDMWVQRNLNEIRE